MADEVQYSSKHYSLKDYKIEDDQIKSHLDDSHIAWSEKMLQTSIQRMETYRDTYLDISVSHYEEANRTIELTRRTGERVLELLEIIPILSKEHIEDLIKVKNPWALNLNQRWMIYAYWRQIVIKKLIAERERIEQRHKALKDKLTKMKLRKMQCIANAWILLLLQHQAVRIIIEEAGEVLEAHTLVSMTSACEHLILIGDHQQLRPPTAVYHLAKDYNLDVSMFERLIRLGVNKASLSVQHRMRPDVARLIAPTIYSNLINHPSVLDYPDIKGMKHNVYFLSHSIPEKEPAPMPPGAPPMVPAYYVSHQQHDNNGLQIMHPVFVQPNGNNMGMPYVGGMVAYQPVYLPQQCVVPSMPFVSPVPEERNSHPSSLTSGRVHCSSGIHRCDSQATSNKAEPPDSHAPSYDSCITRKVLA
ncbi:hypothetical protein QYM36_007267 [Artemia franciscana]|uniref:DNA2/NAM7 helicase helicase domain-containing protein n=1 Tax=Artemia franciscana TaxID=6661 RepID=A0AA88I892_ARTSF|nr:hypothetical protein QYM36_007267 [Artemia franciscana]